MLIQSTTIFCFDYNNLITVSLLLSLPFYPPPKSILSIQLAIPRLKPFHHTQKKSQYLQRPVSLLHMFHTPPSPKSPHTSSYTSLLPTPSILYPPQASRICADLKSHLKLLFFLSGMLSTQRLACSLTSFRCLLFITALLKVAQCLIPQQEHFYSPFVFSTAFVANRQNMYTFLVSL